MSNANDVIVVTTADAQGTASADFDRVQFSLSFRVVEATPAKAKDKGRELVDALNVALDQLHNQEVTFESDTKRSSNSVRPYREWNSKKSKYESKGHVFSYSTTFETKNVDKVSLIQDALTALDQAEVTDPHFYVKNTEGLKAEALKDGFAKAMTRFNNECAVIGKDASKYEVVAWGIRYEDYRHRPAGMAMRSAASAQALGGGAAPPPVEIEAGKAEVNIWMNLSFGLKR